ncbi:S-layer homology domain-containing protein [Paenibacillus sp. tmac-D7]|uniref:S-layer homology domain-containing protein n=1 Tax=Paenibacillus sp. tmac-D7 TaxID=2591462 RepID=UPI0011435ECB|nr:S-layer homology domain-containing protein [Paenibacillus sp. tmac-D7]
MKPSVLQKTAHFTVLMMMLSFVLPVLAYAGTGFKDLTYKNGTVTGTVYSDVYSSSVTPSVYFYDPSGNYLGVTTATYTVYDGVYNYGFTLNNVSTFDYVQVYGPKGTGFNVADSVYQSVYLTTDPGNSGGGGGCCAGGGGSPSTGSESIQVGADGSVNADTLKSSFEKYDTVTLNLSGDSVSIPAKALESFASDTDKLLKVTNANGTYNIPLHVLKLSDLAAKVAVTVSELTVKITIAKADTATSSAVDAAAKQLGGSVLAQPVDFNIVGVGKDGKTAAPDFGSHYLSRVLPLSGSKNLSRATGVLYNPATGKLSFVPTLFTDKQATLKRNGSSLYAVIQLDKSFADISGHWAQPYVELLANKLVVDGVTDTSFQPERSITRAEFAALVVRALGLEPSGSAGSFQDVAASDWFAGVVGTAAAAKLIDGYEDGTFRPNATINREELAAMVVRALAYAKAKPDVTPTEQAALLAKFKDSGTIVWAQHELAVAIYAGIIDGMTSDTLGARQDATRAQSAAMLKRLLVKANFINE